MNNLNFGYDFRNNSDNCFFAPVFDEIEELSYVKRYQNVFDREISEFVSSKLLQREITESFDNELVLLDQNGKYFEAKKNSLDIQQKKSLIASFQ